jgi:hypothetical protein
MLISIELLFFRFFIVCGDRIFANASVSLFQAIIVPFGDRFGVPSAETVATNPSFCSDMNFLILFVIIIILEDEVYY